MSDIEARVKKIIPNNSVLKSHKSPAKKPLWPIWVPTLWTRWNW